MTHPPEPPKPKIKFTGIWIPAEVWILTKLSITEKALYGCIHALGGFSVEGCYASNAFLAERFEVAEGSINNMLNSLKREGLIRQTSRSGQAGKFRQLWLAHPTLPEPKIADQFTPKDVNSTGEIASKDVNGLHPKMQTAPPAIKRLDKSIREVSANGSRQQLKPVLSDEDWLGILKADKTYDGIDVPREFGKMVNWCSVNRKQPSRKRFVNWLNHAERPINASSNGKPTPWERKQEIERIEKAIATHPANHTSVYHDKTATDEQKAALRQLRERKKELEVAV